MQAQTGNSPSPTEEWLRHLPKAELHLHLEGTVTPSTLVTLSERHDAIPLSPEAANALYKYTDFFHFLKTFGMVCARLVTPEDYALITREMIYNLASQGIRHAEVYVAFGGILQTKPELWLRIEEVVSAIEKVRIDLEAELGISILWIVDANRHRGPEECGIVFAKAAELKTKFPSIVGIGIGGNENNGPCEWFKESYAIAKAAGLRLTAHAGESTGDVRGPIEIKTALSIGTERIGHAVAAQYDESLMQELAVKQIPLEINVTSNLCTGVCRSLTEHPLKMYLDHGLMITLNSDDPTMFNSNLLEEYILIHREMGLTLTTMRKLAVNSFQASFLPTDRKETLINIAKTYPLPLQEHQTATMMQ